MTFLELRELALSRAGDHEYFENGTPSVASLARVKVEINTAYKDGVNILAKNKAYPVFTETDVVYAPGDQEKDLKVELTPNMRKLLYVGVYWNDDTTREPRKAILRWSGDRRRQRRPWGNRSVNWRNMYIRGYQQLGFQTAPTKQQTVQVGYAPVAETLSDDGDIPLQIPEEHHEYIAQMAAFNLIASEAGQSNPLGGRLRVLTQQLELVGPEINQFSPRVIGQWTNRY